MNLASALSFYIGCCYPSCLSFIASGSYRVWITSNAKRQYKTLPCNIKVKEHKKPTLKPWMRYHHLAVTRIELTHSRFIFFFYLFLLRWMPVILFLTMIHLPLALVNIVEKQQKKREDKTVSTPMWDSFRHFFFLHTFFSHTHRFRVFVCVCFLTRDHNGNTPCQNVLKFRLEMSFREYMPKITWHALWLHSFLSLESLFFLPIALCENEWMNGWNQIE